MRPAQELGTRAGVVGRGAGVVGRGAGVVGRGAGMHKQEDEMRDEKLSTLPKCVPKRAAMRIDGGNKSVCWGCVLQSQHGFVRERLAE